MSPTDIKRRKYKKDFLKQVIVRLDFDTPLPIDTTGPEKAVYATVKDRFPITEERTVIGKEFQIGRDGTKERSIKTKVWHYFGKDREKHLTISPAFMLIEYSKYELYEKLHDDFFSVSNALFDAYPKLQVKRLGLRYIDNIDPGISGEDPTEWDKYLKPALNAIFALADKREAISRAFHVLELNYGEDSLRFQFGMFNPDYPAPIKRKIYTLDCDVYATRLLNRNEIDQTLNRFHEKASHCFEEVITNKLRRLMEPLDG